VGWAGERMTFAQLSEGFLRSHSSTLSAKSQENHQNFLKNLRAYFGDRKLTEIDERSVVEYRNDRHCQPLKRDPRRTVKGATVKRELACLHCMFQFALKRKYIGENPAADVKHFNERHERPSKRMLTVEDEHRILEAAPPHLRVAIVLLVQTGGRTYTEGLSLRWNQVDLLHGVLHLGDDLKTPTQLKLYR
jgi:site-specific recombinase XerD